MHSQTFDLASRLAILEPTTGIITHSSSLSPGCWESLRARLFSWDFKAHLVSSHICADVDHLTLTLYWLALSCLSLCYHYTFGGIKSKPFPVSVNKMDTWKWNKPAKSNSGCWGLTELHWFLKIRRAKPKYPIRYFSFTFYWVYWYEFWK